MGWVLGYIVPAISRRFSRAYTQEHLHEMSLNPELHLGDAYAEVALVAMQVLLPTSSQSQESVPRACVSTERICTQIVIITTI